MLLLVLVAVVPANAQVLQTAFSQACHNVKPATDAILRGHGAANAIQQLGKQVHQAFKSKN